MGRQRAVRGGMLGAARGRCPWGALGEAETEGAHLCARDTDCGERQREGDWEKSKGSTLPSWGAQPSPPSARASRLGGGWSLEVEGGWRRRKLHSGAGWELFLDQLWRDDLTSAWL